MEPDLALLIDAAVQRTFTTMRRYAPVMARTTTLWAEHLAVVGSAADYFKHILGFPALQIPYWLEKSLGLAPDLELQRQLVYSSINGYYFIRLIDNIMDGHASVEPDILPVAAFFHTESVGVFNPLFSAEHPFWEAFKRAWYASAEVNVQDRANHDKSEVDFRAISSRKVNAAKIPLIAVCHLRHRPDLIEPWSHWIDTFGMWHLFEEDVFDWHKDLRDGVRTYFLCEGERRRRRGEVIEAWAMRDGVKWGVDKLRHWMPEVERATAALESPEALTYVRARSDYLARRVEKLAPGMAVMNSLLSSGWVE